MGKRNKISILTAVFGLVSAPLMASAALNPAMFGSPIANAQEVQNSLVLRLIEEEAVDLEDLGVINPGILNTNPFYFMKQFRRTTLRAFKFNAVEKAEFELNTLNEKAAELKRLEEIIPDNSEVLVSALDAYEATLDNLGYYLARIERDDRNAGLSDLLNRLLDAGLKHSKLFDQLEPDNDPAGSRKLSSLEKKLGAVVTSALIKLDNQESSRIRFASVLANQPGGAFKALRSAEILDSWEGSLPLNEWLSELLLQSKEDLLLETQARIVISELNSVLPALLERLPGDSSARIRVMDESREYFTDQELKNDFSLVRQLLLELSENSRKIGKTEAEHMLARASKTAEFLENKIQKENLRSKSLNELLANAEFNLEQAEESFAIGQYASSFGQASVAAAAAKNSLNRISFTDNLSYEMGELRNKYDSLFSQAADNSLNQESNQRLFELLALSERVLVELSDLAAEEAGIDKIMPVLRNSKVLLWQLELELNGLIAELKEKFDREKAARPLIQRVLK